jgi:hypothetical protein
MAVECLKITNAKEYYLTYGTPYHTGAIEDFEDNIAEKINGKIDGHLFLKINGLILDVKHKVGSSSIPHGRHTSVAKEKLWNYVWADLDGQPNSDIIIRSHVHYFSYCGDGKYLNIVTPSLQGFGSKYGVRQCSGVINIGFIYIDVYEDGSYDWGYKLINYKLSEQNKVILAGIDK